MINKMCAASIMIVTLNLMSVSNACAQIVVDHSDSSIDSALLKQAFDAFANKLQDPLSTQVRSLSSPSKGTICGKLNTKNSFGAYTGFAQFVWHTGMNVPIYLDGSKLDPSAASEGHFEDYFSNIASLTIIEEDNCVPKGETTKFTNAIHNAIMKDIKRNHRQYR